MPVIIPPTRVETIVRSIGYSMLGLSGIWVIFNPPNTIQGEIGSLTLTWGVCMISAFICAVAGYLRRYRVEYVALPMTITGVTIYAYTVWSLVPGSITRGPQALIVSVVACMLLVRLLTLHRLVISWKGNPWIGSQRSSQD